MGCDHDRWHLQARGSSWAAELGGVHRDVFLQALKAEGVPIGTGYTTLVHEMPVCTGQGLRESDRRRFTGRNIDAAREGRFPNAEHARSHTSMRMVHNWIQGDDALVDDVARAIHKVVDHIHELEVTGTQRTQRTPGTQRKA